MKRGLMIGIIIGLGGYLPGCCQAERENSTKMPHKHVVASVAQMPDGSFYVAPAAIYVGEHCGVWIFTNYWAHKTPFKINGTKQTVGSQVDWLRVENPKEDDWVKVYKADKKYFVVVHGDFVWRAGAAVGADDQKNLQPVTEIVDGQEENSLTQRIALLVGH